MLIEAHPMDGFTKGF